MADATNGRTNSNNAIKKALIILCSIYDTIKYKVQNY